MSEDNRTSEELKEAQLTTALRILFSNYVPTEDQWADLGVNGSYGQTDARAHAVEILKRILLDQELPPTVDKQKQNANKEAEVNQDNPEVPLVQDNNTKPSDKGLKATKDSTYMETVPSNMKS